VSEERRHDVERLSATHQLHGHGVAKHMRLGADGKGNAGPAKPPTHVVIEGLRRQGSAFAVEPDRIPRARLAPDRSERLVM
jgi:hypothetical protein